MNFTDEQWQIIERALRQYAPRRESGPLGPGIAAREQHAAREIADRIRVER